MRTRLAVVFAVVRVVHKETRPGARGLTLSLGNISMAIYLLRELARLPAGAPVEALLLRRRA